MLHTLVDKTLYTTNWASTDTCTSVAFLTTRVRETIKYEWGKILHLANDKRGTRDSPLILRTTVSGFLKWWIDASYAVHSNMRGNTRGGPSTGRGFIIVTSTNHNLNTCSSTESYIVGVQDCMLAV